MSRLFGFVLIVLVLTFTACNNSSDSYKKLIVGKWQLVNFTTNQKVKPTESYKRMIKQMILTTSMDIKSDGTITSYIWGSKQTGYWKVQGDYLVVTDKKNKKNKDTFKAKIVKLDENQLLLYYRIDSVEVMLYFKKGLLN
jgi:hypothetical protein